jgi:hypothetical protein
MDAERSLAEQVSSAIGDRDAGKVRSLLAAYPASAGHLVRVRGKGEQTALHMVALWTDDLELAALLLQHAADPNARAIDGCTPLHDAVKRGNGEMVDLLIRSGADASLKDDDNMIPFYWCFKNGYRAELLGKESPAACLLRHGQLVNLFDALRLGLIDHAEKLLERPVEALEGIRAVHTSLPNRLLEECIYYLNLLCNEAIWLRGRDCSGEERLAIVHSILEKKGDLLQKLAALPVPQPVHWTSASLILESGNLELLRACIPLGVRADVSEPMPDYEANCRRIAAVWPEAADVLRQLGFPL